MSNSDPGPSCFPSPDLLCRILVDAAKEYAIFALDLDGRIVSWNIGAERIKGFNATEILGQSFSIFYTPEARLSGLPTRLLDSARSLGQVEDEGWRVRKDGSRFWADVIITSLRDRTGDLLGFSKITRDVTERRKAEISLRVAKEAAERALAQVRQLHGLLPICSYCKKIRDDHSYWHEVDAYIKAHADVQFSHGICPDCFTRIAEPQVDHSFPGSPGNAADAEN